ncbi:hypothetical protein BDZ97DRAFT_1851611 [Flammula alnicola]|nr:hypothetical protein BDZ97DRAFT_1851611 [Flammula alnicola]
MYVHIQGTFFYLLPPLFFLPPYSHFLLDLYPLADRRIGLVNTPHECRTSISAAATALSPIVAT